MADGGEVKDIHRADTTKTLLKSEDLYEYTLNTMVYPREHECLRELRLITEKHTYGYMCSPPDEALLLSMLLKLTGAKNTIEVGVLTGCSVLATALAIPDDGKVVAIDVSREYFDIGLPLIEKAGVAHKVDFRERTGRGLVVGARRSLPTRAGSSPGLGTRACLTGALLQKIPDRGWCCPFKFAGTSHAWSHRGRATSPSHTGF